MRRKNLTKSQKEWLKRAREKQNIKVFVKNLEEVFGRKLGLESQAPEESEPRSQKSMFDNEEE